MTKSYAKYHKILYPLNKQVDGDGWVNNLLMQKDGALIGNFPYGSTNRIGGSGASNLDL